MKLKSCYSLKFIGDPVRIGIADLTDYYNKGAMITRINIPILYRGLGKGTELLKLILSDADSKKETLFLEIQDSDGLKYSELEAWYVRHGFKYWQGIYRRTPQ